MAHLFSLIDILDGRIQSKDYRKGEKARFRLMKAAAELLNTTPLAQIRNVDICRQADIAVGMLNTYFEDKHDLVAQVLELFAGYFEDTFAERAAAIDEEDDDYLRIYDKIDYIVGTCQQNLGIYRLLILESPEQPALRSVRSSSLRFWVGDMAAMIPDERAGQVIRSEDKLKIAAMLSGMVDEAMRVIFFSGEDTAQIDRPKLVQTLALLRYSAIFGRDPERRTMEAAEARARLLEAEYAATL